MLREWWIAANGGTRILVATWSHLSKCHHLPLGARRISLPVSPANILFFSLYFKYCGQAPMRVKVKIFVVFECHFRQITPPPFPTPGKCWGWGGFNPAHHSQFWVDWKKWALLKRKEPMHFSAKSQTHSSHESKWSLNLPLPPWKWAQRHHE